MRLFVAIELSAAIKAELQAAQRSLNEFGRLVRWVRPEQMHLTLKFLGETPERDVPRICEALAAAGQEAAPFTISTGPAGCFPPGGRVRVVWIGLADETGRLAACQAAVESHLERAGVPREDRPFTPHLTLGRVNEDTTGGRLRTAVESCAVKSLSQDVTEFVLMQSELRREGARYTRVGGWRLGAGQ
jgi:2'-5' RNA ligase